MATITTLNASDTGSTSRGVINTNFDNLNSDKAETSALSAYLNKSTDDLDDINAGTTNVHFTATDESKLDGIEAGADVTDATNIGTSIHGSTAKTTPVDADTVPLIDSAASNVLKKVTWANIKATLKTYFDSLYPSSSAFITHIEDDSNPHYVTADQVLPDQTDNSGKVLGTNGTTASWVDSGGTPEGTAIKSTGETGGTKFLREDGDGTCSWQTVSGSGDVVGPASATDNAIARFDSTTGKLIQSSSSSIDDNGTINLGASADIGIANGRSVVVSGSSVELVKFERVLSAVNEITVKNNTTTNAPELKATGDDTNISLNLVPKGTGTVKANGVDVVTTTGTQTLTNKTLTSPNVNEAVALTATATELNVLDGIPATLTATELGYVDGVTSAIQTQLNAKAPTASPTFTGTVTLPTGLTGVIRTDSGVVSVDTDVTDIVSAASDTAAGKVELATAAETTTGTDTGRAVTPDGLAGSDYGKRILAVQVFDGTTALATGDGKAYLPITAELNGWNIVGVGATLIAAASSSGTPTVQIARGRQSSATSNYSYVDVLSTAITIDASEWHSRNATTAAVINTSNDDLATGDILRVDVDVAGTGAQGLIVYAVAQLP